MQESYEEKLSCALDQVTDLKSTFNRIGEYEFKSYRESVYRIATNLCLLFND